MHVAIQPGPIDTIAAVATATGQGGIGIIRISGTKALHILQCLFRPSHNPGSFFFIPRMLHHGWVHFWHDGSQGETLDEVLAVFMPGPATATGEDVGEIQCHGGPAILAAVLESAIAAGARVAERGEFTYRAFYHGKIDLTQAEAVAEMIASPARQGVRLAQAKLAGVFGQRITALRAQVEELRARIALAVDFPEDEGECLDSAVFTATLDSVRQDMRNLLAGYKRARPWQEGVLVVLAGKVNVGKSSLLNALLGRERAIVSSVPGTTRDFIEEAIDIDGLRVRLTDTAGLRDSDDAIEQEGVVRSYDLAVQADLILVVVEAGQELDADERHFLTTHQGNVLLVLNKADALPEMNRLKVASQTSLHGIPCAVVSAKTGWGLEVLATRIRSTILAKDDGCSSSEPMPGDLAPNLRQSQCIEAALAEADSLSVDLLTAIPCDLLGVRLDSMAASLDEIIGFAAPDAILGQIFSRFCIGK